jgi:hypothetical protein
MPLIDGFQINKLVVTLDRRLKKTIKLVLILNQGSQKKTKETGQRLALNYVMPSTYVRVWIF